MMQTMTPAVVMAYLDVMQSKLQRPQVIPLPEQVVIGRGNRFFVEDLHSINGTYVGAERLAPGATRLLCDGDEVRICSTCLTFHCLSTPDGEGGQPIITGAVDATEYAKALREAMHAAAPAADHASAADLQATVQKLHAMSQVSIALGVVTDRHFSAQESIVAQPIRSVMCVPLLLEAECLGLIQVDTASDPYAFKAPDLEMLTGVCAEAAVTLKTFQLYSDIERLRDGFVRASVQAIEERDPATAGHSFRVADFAERLAHAVDRAREAIALQLQQLQQVQQVQQHRLAGGAGGPPMLLEPFEFSALCLSRGSLTAEERQQVEMHVADSHAFLILIPWTDDLAGVPANAHIWSTA